MEAKEQKGNKKNSMVMMMEATTKGKRQNVDADTHIRTGVCV